MGKLLTCVCKYINDYYRVISLLVQFEKNRANFRQEGVGGATIERYLVCDSQKLFRKWLICVQVAKLIHSDDIAKKRLSDIYERQKIYIH